MFGSTSGLTFFFLERAESNKENRNIFPKEAYFVIWYSSVRSTKRKLRVKENEQRGWRSGWGRLTETLTLGSWKRPWMHKTQDEDEEEEEKRHRSAGPHHESERKRTGAGDSRVFLVVLLLAWGQERWVVQYMVRRIACAIPTYHTKAVPHSGV